jgi:RimJ/RimL family protein N-acetyltransferase
MRIRPYISDLDYEYIEKWVDNEKIHALWCANLIPYPISKKTLQDFLDKNAIERKDCAYIATEDNGTPIGFFIYSVNLFYNTGFLKFIILDNQLRGKGYGNQMIKLLLKYAFDISGVISVSLNVFDVNIAAKKCYLRIGFKEHSVTESVFPFYEERWGRCRMVIMIG